MNKILEFSTNKNRELVNITSRVEEAIAQVKLTSGICLIFVPHATAALLINEDEPGFKADVEKLLEMWIPQGDWQHDRVDDNATSHLASSLIGQSKVLPLENGRLQLGTWQEIFFVELDGPRSNRKVIVQAT
ncbi:MAG TPA: secondary thiamine-phosphate synthase enzyme YjbQ [Candidatus Nanoarchaeia archaeon]